MLPELMDLYMVASVGFLWGNITCKQTQQLFEYHHSEFLPNRVHQIESTSSPENSSSPSTSIAGGMGLVRASLLCKDVFTLQNNSKEAFLAVWL